ncbi:MAG: hypothetical protein PHP14_00515 [Candidatus Pacebacteria bacterium]|nr:hypothetical protein [Candidatus Paceibacterota bacterium]MDD3808452.1 hypothetical protein [Candidatus Paceibacterota bacterium]
MAGVTEDDISTWIDNNKDSIYDSFDWQHANGDLNTGKTSNNIWEAIKFAIENKNE